MCPAQGHNTVPPKGIEPRTSRFRFRCSTTTPPRAARFMSDGRKPQRWFSHKLRLLLYLFMSYMYFCNSRIILIYFYRQICSSAKNAQKTTNRPPRCGNSSRPCLNNNLDLKTYFEKDTYESYYHTITFSPPRNSGVLATTLFPVP